MSEHARPEVNPKQDSTKASEPDQVEPIGYYAHSLLHLQRVVGNQVVERLPARGHRPVDNAVARGSDLPPAQADSSSRDTGKRSAGGRTRHRSRVHASAVH
jgi:hypothetical protein